MSLSIPARVWGVLSTVRSVATASAPVPTVMVSVPEPRVLESVSAKRVLPNWFFAARCLTVSVWEPSAALSVALAERISVSVLVASFRS